MGDEHGDDAAAERVRADAYSSARIGAAAAFTLVLVVLLVLDVVVPGYDVSPGTPSAPPGRHEADVPEEKAGLLHAIYERIVVAGSEIVRVRLTSAAYAHGLALTLPERLQWRARQELSLQTPPVSSGR